MGTETIIRMVARQVAANAIDPELGTEPHWENYPEVGEHDWEAVQSELLYIARTLRVEPFIYDHAYGQLAERADPEAT